MDQDYELYIPIPPTPPRLCDLCGHRLADGNRGMFCRRHVIEERLEPSQPLKNRIPDSLIYAILDEPREILARKLAVKYDISATIVRQIRIGDKVPSWAEGKHSPLTS